MRCRSCGVSSEEDILCDECGMCDSCCRCGFDADELGIDPEEAEDYE